MRRACAPRSPAEDAPGGRRAGRAAAAAALAARAEGAGDSGMRRGAGARGREAQPAARPLPLHALAGLLAPRPRGPGRGRRGRRW